MRRWVFILGLGFQALVAYGHIQNVFIGAQLDREISFRSPLGWGATLGYSLDFVRIDLSYESFQPPYAAIQVFQSPLSWVGPATDSAVLLNQTTDAGSLSRFGPGISVVHPLLGSQRWVEIGKIGLAYTRYQNRTQQIDFTGGTVQFSGAIGYQYKSILLSLGLGWNVAYLSRKNSPVQTPDSNFLPLQWWEGQVAMTVAPFELGNYKPH